MLCYGLSLAIAYAILLNFSACLACVLVALLGAILVWKWYYKEVVRLSE